MRKRSRPWEEAFLAALESTGVISQAAKAADVPRRTVYDHLKADLEFHDKAAHALDTAGDNLQAELMRCALEGEQQPVYYKGEVVGHINKKNDAMLMHAIANLRHRRSELDKAHPIGGLSSLLDL